MKYKPRSLIRTYPVNIHVPTEDRPTVLSMMEEFGLDKCFSMNYVYFHWKDYSIASAATWITPTKENIEYVFGLKLEEDND